jgi:hypothetical protein
VFVEAARIERIEADGYGVVVHRHRAHQRSRIDFDIAGRLDLTLIRGGTGQDERAYPEMQPWRAHVIAAQMRGTLAHPTAAVLRMIGRTEMTVPLRCWRRALSPDHRHAAQAPADVPFVLHRMRWS